MRARFTTDEIAAAALRIVDTDGLSALSMRSLAQALGTGAMTAYNYVSDKEGLEELVVAAVFADMRLPTPTEDWVRDTHAIASEMWQCMRAHPAAVPLVLTRRTVSPTGFAAAEALVAALERASLPPTDLLAAFHAVLGFVVGAGQSELAGQFTRARNPAEAASHIGSVAGERYPRIEALSKVAMRTPVEKDFDRGMRMLLDGVAACATQQSRRSRPKV